jgi:soluble lytic murein transglycosylase-like protein
MPDHRRIPLAAVAAVVLLVLLVPSSASIPAPVQHQPPAPSASELALLEELSHWVRAGESRYRLFDEAALGGLLREQRRSFELFRNFNGAPERQRLLANLPYGELIQEAADHYRLDSLLLAAVVQAESGFDPRAVSPRGAQGLMQLMPSTAAAYGVVELGDPRANVRAGARYLSELLVRFDDDLELALAAYNAGPGNVLRYGGVPPFRETQRYVDRVLGGYVEMHRELWRDSELAEVLEPAMTVQPAAMTVAQAR